MIIVPSPFGQWCFKCKFHLQMKTSRFPKWKDNATAQVSWSVSFALQFEKQYAPWTTLPSPRIGETEVASTPGWEESPLWKKEQVERRCMITQALANTLRQRSASVAAKRFSFRVCSRRKRIFVLASEPVAKLQSRRLPVFALTTALSAASVPKR